VLSALGRLSRAGELEGVAVSRMLARQPDAPIERHPVADLLAGAWSKRARLRLADALYVELAERLGVRLVTTDPRLRRVRSSTSSLERVAETRHAAAGSPAAAMDLLVLGAAAMAGR
jgi:predicted nucleic acid-binding protein